MEDFQVATNQSGCNYISVIKTKKYQKKSNQKVVTSFYGRDLNRERRKENGCNEKNRGCDKKEGKEYKLKS